MRPWRGLAGGSRRGAALVGLGWVLPTLAFAITNPGGDVLLPDLTRTYVYLFGSALFVVSRSSLPLPRGAAALAAEGRAHRHPVTRRTPSRSSLSSPEPAAFRGGAPAPMTSR